MKNRIIYCVMGSFLFLLSASACAQSPAESTVARDRETVSGVDSEADSVALNGDQAEPIVRSEASLLRQSLVRQRDELELRLKIAELNAKLELLSGEGGQGSVASGASPMPELVGVIGRDAMFRIGDSIVRARAGQMVDSRVRVTSVSAGRVTISLEAAPSRDGVRDLPFGPPAVTSGRQ